MLQQNQSITYLYEKWEVTVTKTPEADKEALNINSNKGHRVTADSYNYEKIKKVGEKRLFPSVANDFNTQAHNRGIRYYQVEGSAIDHSKEPMEIPADVASPKKKNK